MDSPVKSPQPQGVPLLPMTPERINQQKDSPSPTKSVQSKIAFLNGLAGKRSPSPAPAFQSSTTSAALQRAILGREEAESALEGAVSQLSEARARERKISERIESLLEELQSTKKQQAHERGVFEKEVRKARKEAFRAGSNVVKAQEELKSSRSEIQGLKDELAQEREAKDQAKQEAFENTYKLAGVTEELTALKEKLRSLEADNHTGKLEASAIEMRQNTPETRPALAELSVNSSGPITPVRRPGQKVRTPSSRIIRRKIANRPLGLLQPPAPLPPLRKFRKNMDPDNIDLGYVEDLEIDLKLERNSRLEALDHVKFLHMECQFLDCACRRAERRGSRFVFDVEYDQKMQEEERRKKESEECGEGQEASGNPKPPKKRKITDEMEIHGSQPEEPEEPEEPLITFSPDTGTFHPVPSPAKENLGRSEPQRSRIEESIHNEDSACEQPSTSQPAPSLKAASPEIAMEDVRPSQSFEHSAAYVQPPTSSVANPPDVSNPKTPPRPSKNAGIHGNRQQTTSNHNHNNSNQSRHNPSSALTKTITTTTTVPLHSEDREKSSDPYATIPGTPVTRQEALAQIQARRGRARSNANRSVSASEINSRPPSRARPPSAASAPSRARPPSAASAPSRARDPSAARAPSTARGPSTVRGQSTARAPSAPRSPSRARAPSAARAPSRARPVTPARKGRQTPGPTEQRERDRERVRKVTTSKPDRRHISTSGRS